MMAKFFSTFIGFLIFVRAHRCSGYLKQYLDNFIVDQLFYEKSTVFDKGLNNVHVFARIPVNFDGPRHFSDKYDTEGDFIDLLVIFPSEGAPLSDSYYSLDELKPHIPKNSNHLIVFKAYKKSIRTMAEHFNLDYRAKKGNLVIFLVDYNKNWFKQSDKSKDFCIIAQGITQLCNFIHSLGKIPSFLGFSFGCAMCLGTIEEMVRNGTKIGEIAENDPDHPLIHHIFLLAPFKSLTLQLTRHFALSYINFRRVSNRYSFNNEERLLNLLKCQKGATKQISLFHGIEDALIPYSDSVEMSIKNDLYLRLIDTFHCGLICKKVVWEHIFKRIRKLNERNTFWKYYEDIPNLEIN